MTQATAQAIGKARLKWIDDFLSRASRGKAPPKSFCLIFSMIKVEVEKPQAEHPSLFNPTTQEE